MSVSVIAAEHALRLVADENTVFYVMKEGEKIKLPYSGTIKVRLKGTVGKIDDENPGSYSVKLRNSTGEIDKKSFSISGWAGGTSAPLDVEMYANVTKDEAYYVSIGETENIIMKNLDILLYAAPVYGNKPIIVVEE